MAQFFQWVATPNEVLAALSVQPRVGATAEFIPSGNGRAEFWVVEKLRQVRIGYSRDDVVALKVTESQMRTFLTARGETLPATIEVYVRPSVRGGLYNDEVVVVDSSMTVTRL